MYARLKLAAMVCFITKLSVHAELTMPSIFSDHMVLQRERPVPVWGKANPGDIITVSFSGQSAAATADSSGRWRVLLEPLKTASIPETLTVRCNSEVLAFHDVLVGEVWLCSGQSNMEWSMDKTTKADPDLTTAGDPLIRIYRTPRRPATTPAENSDAVWQRCSPQSLQLFSGVAYYFGRKLRNDLDVPVGLLLAAWGGTRIEPWIPLEGFAGIDSLRSIREAAQHIPEPADTRSGYLKNPTVLYNGMINPHVPFAIRGALWYQGEANVSEGMLYVEKTKALLSGWRQKWGYDFPFYFVQIAPYQYENSPSDMLPLFWEAQASIPASIPGTAMAVIYDTATPDNIHPPDKETPGIRLALLAEARTYGMDVVCDGPVFQSLETIPGALKIYFRTANELTTRDGKSPDWFEVAGRDGIFRPAEASIEGNTVIARSAEVPHPVSVRFGWHKTAVPNLTNRSGLPAWAFRASL